MKVKNKKWKGENFATHLRTQPTLHEQKYSTVSGDSRQGKVKNVVFSLS
ncbi:MAG: hypothetical protein LBG58_16145 [Planctomycetaceae bacterium]|jgi:hypothetical protein|nr:hypothetical protein [Planctomycetaceae bacterium]